MLTMTRNFLTIQLKKQLKLFFKLKIFLRKIIRPILDVLKCHMKRQGPADGLKYNIVSSGRKKIKG